MDKVALVKQQADFLSTNLDYKMEKLSGEFIDGRWTKENWQSIIDENLLLICTPAVLHKSLGHSFISMSGINLIIFDEAHHADKNHPYARIIKDFYNFTPTEHKPRIMGLTASPASAAEPVERASFRLEKCLASSIATVSSETLEEMNNKVQNEELQFYLPNEPPVRTELWEEMQKRLGTSGIFGKMLTFSHSASSELGVWASDRFWHLCLTDTELKKLVLKAGGLEYKPQGFGPIKNWEAVGGLVAAYLQDNPQEPISFDYKCLSNKTLRLLHLLRDRFSCLEGQRCIVFVEMRYTAVLLNDLCRQEALEIPGLRTAAFVRPQALLRTSFYPVHSLTVL